MHPAFQTISVLTTKLLIIILPLNVKAGRKVDSERSLYKTLLDTEFDAGDLVKTNDGLLMIGVDKRTLVYLEVRKEHGVVRQIDKYRHSQVWDGRLFRRVESGFPFGRSKGYAVAKALVNCKVPYGRWRCNQHHYIDYFLLGRVRGRLLSCSYGPMSSWCPLARNLVTAFGNSIGGPEFYLQDKNRNKIYLKDLDFVRSRSASPQPAYPVPEVHRSFSSQH